MNETWGAARVLRHSRKWESDLKQRLAEYFTRQGYPLHSTKSYILRDRSYWHKNIISDNVVKYITKQEFGRSGTKEPFSLHKWIHHGLSSQAFLFNILGPLVAASKWSAFDEILERAGIFLSSKVVNAKFELQDREVFEEHRAQPTLIDLCVYTQSGENIFVECKFTEKGFGGCSVIADGDCDGRNPANDFSLCYLHQEGRSYWEQMKNCGLLSSEIRNSIQCPFATLYQFYRLVLFSLKNNGQFLLLYDKRNPSFVSDRGDKRRGLFVFGCELLPHEAVKRCHAISVQDLLPVLQRHFGTDLMNELIEKYFGRM